MTSGTAFTMQLQTRPWQHAPTPRPGSPGLLRQIERPPFPMVDGARAPIRRLRGGRSPDMERDVEKVFSALQWPEFAETVRDSCCSHFEKKVSMAMTEVGIPHLYELCKFRLTQDKYTKYTYRSDFITPLLINGRRVYLEPHGKEIFESGDLEKFTTFHAQYGDRYYGILITDATEGHMEMLRRKCRIKINKIADEIWMPISHDRAVSGIYLRLMLADLKLRAMGRRVDDDIEAAHTVAAEHLEPMGIGIRGAGMDSVTASARPTEVHPSFEIDRSAFDDKPF